MFEWFESVEVCGRSQPSIMAKRVIRPPVHRRNPCQGHGLPRPDVYKTRILEVAVPAGGDIFFDAFGPTKKIQIIPSPLCAR